MRDVAVLVREQILAGVYDDVVLKRALEIIRQQKDKTDVPEVTYTIEELKLILKILRKP